jgi:hypothetical protein
MIVFSYIRLLTSADKDSLTLLALMTTAASYDIPGVQLKHWLISAQLLCQETWYMYTCELGSFR